MHTHTSVKMYEYSKRSMHAMTTRVCKSARARTLRRRTPHPVPNLRHDYLMHPCRICATTGLAHHLSPYRRCRREDQRLRRNAGRKSRTRIKIIPRACRKDTRHVVPPLVQHRRHQEGCHMLRACHKSLGMTTRLTNNNVSLLAYSSQNLGT